MCGIFAYIGDKEAGDHFGSLDLVGMTRGI